MLGLVDHNDVILVVRETPLVHVQHEEKHTLGPSAVVQRNLGSTSLVSGHAMPERMGRSHFKESARWGDAACAFRPKYSPGPFACPLRLA